MGRSLYFPTEGYVGISPDQYLEKLKLADGVGSGLDVDTVRGHRVIQQGTGPGQDPDTVIQLGWDNTHVRMAENGNDLGVVITDANIVSLLKTKNLDYYTPAQVYESVATNGSSGNCVIFDALGNLYWAVSNSYNGTTFMQTSYVYKITPAGAMTTFASVATNGAESVDLAFDALGNLYWAVSSYYNDTTYNLTSYVYKITPAGTLTTFASVATIGATGVALAFDAAGNLYWAVSNLYNGSYNLTSYVYKITPAGTLTTFASVATNGAHKADLAFDAAGNLYWAVSNFNDGSTHNLTSYVYKITPAGAMTTFASVATLGGIGTSLLFDAAGNLYWAVSNLYNDSSYNLTSYVYKITPAGTLTTFASVATNGAYNTTLTFDAFGNFYWTIANFSDGVTGNITSYIYKITPVGALSTFASVATNKVVGVSLVFDASGDIYWATGNYHNGSSYNLNSYLYRIDVQDIVYVNP